MSRRSILRYCKVRPCFEVLAVSGLHDQALAVIGVGEHPLSRVQSLKVPGGHDLIDDTPYHFSWGANNAAYSAFPGATVSRTAQLPALSFGYNGVESILGIWATLSHLSNVHVGTIRKNKLTP